MDAEQLKQMYGTEYPDAVTVFGMRMPLAKERRFTRTYTNKEHNHKTDVSRFADGSASITLAELRDQWPDWPEEDKRDFCSACDWLHGHPDFPEILRFIMNRGGHVHWSTIANSLPYALPTEEAFGILSKALRETPCNTANITQAIAGTKHPNAEHLLREHLADLWARDGFWADDPFLNWTAFDATCCIAHLLELGIKPGNLEHQVRALTKHACVGNRQSCGTFLHKFYEWIPQPEVPRFGGA
jgi:hypothetical protein